MAATAVACSCLVVVVARQDQPNSAGARPSRPELYAASRGRPPTPERSASALAFSLGRACADDDRGRVVVGDGQGPVVALVADSLGSQLRNGFLSQGDVRAVVAAHCGAQIAGPLDDGTVEAVLAEQPRTLVLALGTNSISENFAPAPELVDWRLPEVERMLVATDGVPCRVWVNVAAVDRAAREPDASMFIALARRFNDHLARAAASANGRVVVADWDALVASRPGLLMADGIHLTPAGEAARLQLIRDTLASACR